MNEDDRLRRCIASILKCEPETLNDDSGLGMTAGWDSLAHTMIVIALEQEFDIAFDFDELDQVISFDRIRTSLERKGVAVGSP